MLHHWCDLLITVDLSHLNPSMVIIEVESQDGDVKMNKIILLK